MLSNKFISSIYRHRLTLRGFGLIELLVSISIITLVSSIILTRQSAFNGTILLRNQAYEVAYAIRQAQLLAVSGTDGGDASVVTQFGVVFNISSTGHKNTYIVFQDNNNNGMYDTKTDDIIGAVGQIDHRFHINALHDSSNSGHNSMSHLTITFKRPNFDGIFRKGTNNGTLITNAPVYIDIARIGTTGTGPSQVRRVEVTSTGQISVVNY